MKTINTYTLNKELRMMQLIHNGDWVLREDILVLIDERIKSIKSSLNCLTYSNERLIREFKAQLQELEELKKEITG